MPKIVFMLLLCLLLAGCEAVGRGIAAELLDESRSVEKSGRCVVTGYRVPGTESHLHPGETVKILMTTASAPILRAIPCCCRKIWRKTSA